MTLTSGARLGPYEIQSPLGAGGMGEVYRATQSSLGHQVAIRFCPRLSLPIPSDCVASSRKPAPPLL